MAVDPRMPSRPATDSASAADSSAVGPLPTDVPAIVQADRRLAQSDFAGAVRVAFPLVMIDLQWVYNLSFPRHWTARDVLAHGLRSDMGRLPDLLFQFYEIYEPIRYGQEQDWVRGDLREILRRIYTETGLRNRGAQSEGRRTLPPETFSVVPPGRRARPPEEGKRW